MKSLLILFLVNTFQVEAQLIIPKQVETTLNKSVIKNIKKKNIKCKNCAIQLIYWIEYHDNDSLNEIRKLDKQIVNSLSLCNKNESSVNLKTRKGINNLLYTAVIYDTLSNKAKYFQSEKFHIIYSASIYEIKLMAAIKRYSIKNVFYIVNAINRDSPYLLEDLNGKLYIFYVNFNSFDEARYEVVPIEKYEKSLKVSKN